MGAFAVAAIGSVPEPAAAIIPCSAGPTGLQYIHLRSRQRKFGAVMLEAAKYSASELIRNGDRVEIRSLRGDDRTKFMAAVERVGAQSFYRRFFAAKRGFTEDQVAFFLNADFVTHVALVAVLEEAGRPAIVGGGRYIVVEPGKA